MKILVIGSGGREHAIAWKFAQSAKTERVFVAPGNGGTAAEEKCTNVQLTAKNPSSAAGQEELLQFSLREKIDLAVVGPELPLAEGIVDRFRAAGLAIIGPNKKGARLETSKIYSKSFMAEHGIRTAKSGNFTDPERAFARAREHFSSASSPLVIKADGMAAGKGVIIAANLAEAEAAVSTFMQDKILGDAGTSLVLEEFIDGREVSVLAAVSVIAGNSGSGMFKSSGIILPFISARDHKRRFDNGQGPNTGGMGAVAPVPDFSAAAQNDFAASILEPTLRGMETEGMDYRGFIFFGLMVRNDRCYLLEYNARLGDPETQAVLPLMDFDLVDLCSAILDGSLANFPLKWKNGAVCAPVAVADGYPGAYRKGDPITIDTAALAKTGAKVFIAGAEGGLSSPLCTSGGRVLAVSAFGVDADDAWSRAYRGLDAISFQGMAYRKDIGRENITTDPSAEQSGLSARVFR